MANIDINLSNALVTKFKGNTQTNSISDDLGVLFMVDESFHSTHSSTTNYSLTGGSLRLNYADGAYENYSGVTLANPNATSGTATADSQEEYVPSAYRLTIMGQLNYQYGIGATSTIEALGGNIKAIAFQTLLPTTSPSYNATLGNVTFNMAGNVNISASGGISGVVTSLGLAGDSTIKSTALSGNFTVSGNVDSVAQNTDTLAVSGTATSYTEQYADGSFVSMTNIAIPVTGATSMNKALLANSANLPGDDVINVTLGAVAVNPWSIASGAGNDKVTITGGGASLSVNAGLGNDVITLGDSNHSVDGGAGIDTAVFSGARTAYTLTKTDTGYNVQGSAGTDTLVNVERLHFNDSTLALDISGNAGQVYRLYQAAFNRTPDAGGLGYWIKAADNGATLQSIAAEFIKSDESKAMYGANPNNADFLDKLYHNVLHRAGDKAGYDWWLGHMNAGDTSQAAALAEFGESAENQAALIGVIGNGFTFTPYG
jgi:hypothetical protein